jgi:hypothetical protein
VTPLIAEILLRLAKAAAAAVIAVVVYVVLTGPFAVPPSAELALLAWIASAAFILLVQESPI